MLYINKNISYLRKKNQFSQVKLAELSGVKRNTISNYENGISTPDYQTLLKLARIFDVSIEACITTDIETRSNAQSAVRSSNSDLNGQISAPKSQSEFGEILNKISDDVNAIKEMLLKINQRVS